MITDLGWEASYRCSLTDTCRGVRSYGGTAVPSCATDAIVVPNIISGAPLLGAVWVQAGHPGVHNNRALWVN